MALLFDVRYTTRLLRKSPGFFITAAVTLALGIAATTAMFSIVNAVLLRLPFTQADRLVRFTSYDPIHRISGELAHANVTDWRQANRTFADMAAIGSTNWSFVLEDGDPVSIPNAAVSGNFFDVLGSRALIGRTLTAADDVPGAARVVVVSHRLWRGRFGANPSVVGHVARLSGESYTIVGVMPPTFRYPAGAEVWFPVAPELAELGRRDGEDYLTEPGLNVLHAVGRLRAGVSREQADADLSRLVAEDRRNNERVVVQSLIDEYFGRLQWALVAALGSAFLLLAIACINVSGLVLARVARRRHEWAIRRAVGAGVGDVARLTITEVGLVSIAACVAGLAVVPALIRVITAVDSTGFLSDFPIAIDGRVLAAAMAIGIGSLAVAGLGPALQAARLSDTSSMSLTLRHRPSMLRLRRSLVMAQVGVTTLLLAATGLMVRSVVNLSQLDLGFEAARLIVADPGVPEDLDRERRIVWIETLIADIRGIPGVARAAGVSIAPLQGPIGFDTHVFAEGDPLPPQGVSRYPLVNVESVTPDYFSTMGIRILAGRAFTSADRRARVVIVSESLAQAMWPGEPAIGKRLYNDFLFRMDGIPEDFGTVVGVTANVRYREIERPRFDVYGLFPQSDLDIGSIVIRAAADAETVMPVVRTHIQGLSPARVTSVRSMEAIVGEATAVWRMTLAIFAAFAVFALLLSATGVYGLLSYLSEERTREIGIRVALGARPHHVASWMLGNAAAVVSAGLAIGLTASVAAARVMRSLVFDVSPTDPITLATAGGTLMLIALLATYLPTRRAMRSDPMQILRAD